MYEKMAVVEFRKFKNLKLLKVAFGYFAAVCE